MSLIEKYCKSCFWTKRETLLQSYGMKTIHTSNQGKNSADLQLTIDVMNAMYLTGLCL